MRGGEFHQAIDFAEPGTDVLGKLTALLRLQPLRLTGIELLQEGLAPGGPGRGFGRPVDGGCRHRRSLYGGKGCQLRHAIGLQLARSGRRTADQLAQVLDPLGARRVDRPFPATTALDWPSRQQDPTYLARVASVRRVQQAKRIAPATECRSRPHSGIGRIMRLLQQSSCPISALRVRQKLPSARESAQPARTLGED